MEQPLIERVLDYFDESETEAVRVPFASDAKRWVAAA